MAPALQGDDDWLGGLCLDPDLVVVVHQGVGGEANTVVTAHPWGHQAMLPRELTCRVKRWRRMSLLM